MGMIKPIRTRSGFQRAGNGLPTANVGKGSKWNTPFEVKEVNGIYFLHADNPEAREIMFKHCHNPYRVKVEAQKAALTCYNYWLLPENKTGSLSEFYSQLMANDEELQKLKGKNLMCGCDAEQYCHAELLLQIVN